MIIFSAIKNVSVTVRVLLNALCVWRLTKAAVSTAIVLAACFSFALFSASPLMAANTKSVSSASSKTSNSGNASVAKEATLPDFEKNIAEWNAALERIESTFSEESVSKSALDAARITFEELTTEISSFLKVWKPREEAALERSKKLGPAPGSGQPPENEAIAKQRAELNNTLGALTSAVKAASDALSRTKELEARAGEIRRIQFGRRILRLTDSPLSLTMWQDVATNAPDGLKQIGMVLTDWWSRIADKTMFLLLIIAAIAAGGGMTYISKLGINYFRRGHESEPPSEWRRGTTAGWVIFMRVLPVTIAIAGLYYALKSLELLPPPAVEVMTSATIAIIIVAVVRAVAKTVLAINYSQWRLLPLSDQGALTLYYHLVALAVIYGVDIFISSLNHAAIIQFSLTEAQNAIASISVAGIIISMLRIKASNGDVGSEVHRIGPQYLRIPLWLIALTILASAAAGYIPLARFITAQLIITSTVIIIVYLLSYWANSFGQSLADDESMVGLWLRDQVGLTQERREKLVLPITLLLKVLVILSAVPFIMFLWGFDAHDIRRWVELALFGFDLGNFKISLTGILGALAVFVGAYVAAGIFRVWLDRNVLEPAHVEGSVRDSVRAAVGYLGFILAAIAAVSYAGFDFSNLAIVAGALSVGLGFGMQSIVNNFVSGLILLAERPIKVGDWIVVGEEEGIVRNIHVRATEIETFERANIIIPNSQLISETVKNRTLYNNTRRVRIPVGVHYDSDPDQVRDILLAVANEHSQVLSVPEPFVFFDDFGDNSLNFALYVYLANARQSFSIQTDLRFAILKAFRANGIEIPYPQTDVHFRDIDWIKRAVMERMMKSAVEAAAAEASAKQPDRSPPNEEKESNDSDGDGGGNGNGGG